MSGSREPDLREGLESDLHNGCKCRPDCFFNPARVGNRIGLPHNALKGILLYVSACYGCRVLWNPTYAKVWNLICTMDVNVGRILLLKSGTYGQ